MLACQLVGPNSPDARTAKTIVRILMDPSL